MTISIIVVRAVTFGSYFVRRLIMNTTDNYQQQVPIYLNLTEIFYVAKTNVALPADLRVPSGTYYFQCKYQNILFSRRPVLHTYMLDSVITSVGRFRGSHFSII